MWDRDRCLDLVVDEDVLARSSHSRAFLAQTPRKPGFLGPGAQEISTPQDLLLRNNNSSEK